MMPAMSYSFVILRDGAEPTPCELPPGSYIIGSGPGSHLRLRHETVDDRHARLRLTATEASVDDLDSRTGTAVDGDYISAARGLRPGSRVDIGPYALVLESIPEQEQPVPDVLSTPADEPLEPMEKVPPQPPITPPQSPISKASASDPKMALRREIKNQIHRELVQRLDLKRLIAARVDNEELQRRAKATLDTVINDARARLPADIDPDKLAHDIFNEALRLGPLEDFLADDSITEIMINGPQRVYIERDGKLMLTDQSFMDNASVQAVIERIVSPIGRRIDESQPYVDARLPDGSRVNAIIAPLSLVGPCVTIRKFSRVPLTEADLIGFGTWSAAMARFLDICVKLRKNIIVSGGTGSGKTTLLNVLSAYIPVSDRILTIEDAAELRLEQPHLVRLEARPPNIEGRGAISIRDLVRNSLRMRPDRIIVGECRGGEALDMLQAMNTGHDGSLTTVHANSPRDVIARLETMVMMSGMELPSRAIREQISSAVDLIVHQARLSDGSRRITHITEVQGLEGNQTVMQDIFEFEQTGVDSNGKVIGHHRATGAIPTFSEEIGAHGLELDLSIFQPGDVGGQL